LAVLGAAAGLFSAASAQAADKAPTKTYTVKAGDTLFSIARALLGDQALWAQIYRLNTETITDPNVLQPGMVLKISGEPGVRAVSAQETPPPETPARAPAKEPVQAPVREQPARPAPQPERPAVVVVEPPDEQEPTRSDTLFAKRRGLDARTALRTYREQPYRALRQGEFHSAGYLTEGRRLAFGQLLGTVTPQQIRNLSERSTATLYTEVALAAPAGASYQTNDSLLVVQTFTGPSGYGDIVFPTGMVRVKGRNGQQILGTVIAVYGPIRSGQRVIPTEKFVDGGTSRAQPVANGVEGELLGQRETRELKHPQDYLFINRGSKDGVAPGDVFEIRREPGRREGAADFADELMATVQVVHVSERSATVKILNVVSPDIAPGTRVKQVAKLPS
jgi:hypothetical protein